MMKTYRKFLVVIFCFLYISTSYAGTIGEHPGSDTGTGGENVGGGNVGINDGGRNHGKGSDGTGSPRAGSGGDGGTNGNGSNGSKAEVKPEPRILRLCEINCGVLNQPMEGVVSADRLEEGKVVEHVELQTDSKLEEAANTRQDGIISEGLANDSESQGPETPVGHSNEGIEGESKSVGEMAKKAKNQTQRSDVKSKLDELVKFAESYTAFQNSYNNLMAGRAKDLGKNGEEHDQSSDNISNKTQADAQSKNVLASSVGSESSTPSLENISHSILDFIGGNGTASSVSTSLINFFKSMFNQNPVEAGPYVKEALRITLTGGQPKVLNPIEPVRDQLMEKVRSYLAKDVKIQYSQEKRNGPYSFDCSGFVNYVYAQMGLDIRKANGGSPNVIGIVQSGLFYEIDKSEARQGDLVVHFANENDKEDNHIGLFDSKNEQGKVFEISATTARGFAKLDPVKDEFKNSISKTPAKAFGKI